MPNIGIHGYEMSSAYPLTRKIVNCMKNIGLADDSIWEIFPTKIGTCDGSKQPAPYLKVFVTDFSHAPIIIEGFQKHGIHEDTEVITLGMFFSKKEIATGKWKKQFKGTPWEVKN